MLQFSNTTTKGGLIQSVEDKLFGKYGDISSNPDMLLRFTRYINEGLNRVVSLILKSDGRWQFDDQNNTDLPIGTTSLVTTPGAEQQDYTFDVSHLKILNVEVKDNNGQWHTLIPIDQSDLQNTNVTDFMSEPGLPLYYDKLGSSVFLYPPPLAADVTEANGLKVRFQRPPSYFVSTDTTKTPGFNSLYHELVALIAARDYAFDKTLSCAEGLASRVTEKEQDLIEDYTIRNKDEKTKLSALGTRDRFN